MAKISVAALIAISSGLLTVLPGNAQETNQINPLEGLDTYEGTRKTDGGIDSQTVFDLIHQAQTGRFNIDVNTIRADQQQGIQDAAAEFRAKQRERLQQRESAEVEGTPAATPEQPQQ
ncbi:MAG: hypothetical protein ACFBSC_21940 [Microcoleaceae cyanobacterium]